VIAVCPDPELCEDVTDKYLCCQKDGGRAEDRFAPEMQRYRETVARSKRDHTGSSTQAGTVKGYVLEKAQLSSEDITLEMKRAVKDYNGKRAWYEIPSDGEGTHKGTK